jgi:hypothetical protein
MKPGPTFKFSKVTKRMLASTLDPHEYGKLKKLFIKAQLAAQNVVIKPMKEGDD